jgi:hypothetical protein
MNEISHSFMDLRPKQRWEQGIWNSGMVLLFCCVIMGSANVVAQVHVRAAKQTKPVILSTSAPPSVINVRVDPRSVIDLRGLGASLYSTGLAPVSVMLSHLAVGDPGRDKGPTYLGYIYLVSHGRKLYLGSNYQNKTIRLGVLPEGELQILVASRSESFLASTGPAARNADGLPHATVRDMTNGWIEVHMEMTPRLPEAKLVFGDANQQAYARENYFGDVHLYFTGGVTCDATLQSLLELLKKGGPEERHDAADRLRKSYPTTARILRLFQPNSVEGGASTSSAPLR